MIAVKGFERKPRKALDLSTLEVREEHLYPEVDNADDYRELEPETTDVLVMVPAQIYIRRIVRHKLVLKSNLRIPEAGTDPSAIRELLPDRWMKKTN